MSVTVTADSTLWTADTTCVTADGRIVCIEADIHEAAAALDQLDAAIGAQVLFGTVDEAAAALDALDADVVAAEVPATDGGGGFYPWQRPLPIVGVGYGILPQLWGEAHGTVGVAGKCAAQFLVRVAADGAVGQSGDATAVIKGLSVAATGAVGTRGSGDGVIMKCAGTATGHQDDDEAAAVIAILLAA